MKRLVIQNETDLICLHQILEGYKYFIEQDNCNLSAITSKFIRETIHKIEKLEKLEEK